MDPRRLQDGAQIAPFFPKPRPNPRTPESSLNQNPSSGGAFGKNMFKGFKKARIVILFIFKGKFETNRQDLRQQVA